MGRLQEQAPTSIEAMIGSYPPSTKESNSGSLRAAHSLAGNSITHSVQSYQRNVEILKKFYKVPQATVNHALFCVSVGLGVIVALYRMGGRQCLFPLMPVSVCLFQLSTEHFQQSTCPWKHEGGCSGKGTLSSHGLIGGHGSAKEVAM